MLPQPEHCALLCQMSIPTLTSGACHANRPDEKEDGAFQASKGPDCEFCVDSVDLVALIERLDQGCVVVRKNVDVIRTADVPVRPVALRRRTLARAAVVIYGFHSVPRVIQVDAVQPGRIID